MFSTSGQIVAVPRVTVLGCTSSLKMINVCYGLFPGAVSHCAGHLGVPGDGFGAVSSLNYLTLWAAELDDTRLCV